MISLFDDELYSGHAVDEELTNTLSNHQSGHKLVFGHGSRLDRGPSQRVLRRRGSNALRSRNFSSARSGFCSRFYASSALWLCHRRLLFILLVNRQVPGSLTVLKRLCLLFFFRRRIFLLLFLSAA